MSLAPCRFLYYVQLLYETRVNLIIWAVTWNNVATDTTSSINLISSPWYVFIVALLSLLYIRILYIYNVSRNMEQFCWPLTRVPILVASTKPLTMNLSSNVPIQYHYISIQMQDIVIPIEDQNIIISIVTIWSKWVLVF